MMILQLSNAKLVMNADAHYGQQITCYVNNRYSGYASSQLEYINGMYYTRRIGLESIGATADIIEQYFLEHNINGLVYMEDVLQGVI